MQATPTNSRYREIIGHSAIYGVGEILTRITSFLLLPFYTHYLTPSDYGCIALLDVTATVLAIVVGSGLAAAVNRHHFNADGEPQRDAVWWTGLLAVGLLGGAVIVPAWIARGQIAASLLGGAYPDGTRYITLLLATVWLQTVGRVLGTYLRVLKRSRLVCGLRLVRLLSNVAVNVSLLAAGWGILGILTGNLIVTAVFLAVPVSVFVRSRGPFRLDVRIGKKLARFGIPLVGTGLLALIMHQADRYLLRTFLNMEQVGIYSVAYAIAQGANTVILSAFGSIWGVAIYEIAEQPDAKQVYARVFEYFVFALALAALGLALFAEPLIGLMTSAEYGPAAEIIPVICLAYLFFSLHDHFKVPAMLEKRTVSLIPAYAAGALLNVALNYLLIPRFGATGAAWASVAAFGAFSFIGLWLYRGIDRYPYRFGRIALVVSGMVVSYIVCDVLTPASASLTLRISLGAAVCSVWAGVLFGPLLLRWLQQSPAHLDTPADVPETV